MTPTLRYDPVSQAFHWVTAVAVIAVYAIGLIREDIPKGDFRNGLLSLHMSIGLLVFGLTLARLAWRAGNPAPPALPEPPVIRLAARTVHLALYAAMIAVPLVGLVSAWMEGRLVSFFWLLPLPSPIGLDKPSGETLAELHGLAAHVMIAVAGLHAVAAIGHHMVLKDATLLRMLPERVRALLPAVQS